MRSEIRLYASNRITARVFIVGCPRSGTTLLQSMLGSHPSVQTFPETHFFSHAFPRNRLRRALTLPAWNVRRPLRELVAELGRDDLLPLTHASRWSRDFATPFVRILDAITQDAGRALWVEKTPLHLHYIPQIVASIPNARFVHVLRDGSDVVASLYHATNTHPQEWARHARFRRFRGYSLDECIERWNHDLAITLRHADQPEHHLVRYERLVRDPAAELEAVCRFLGIGYDARMHEGHAVFAQVVRSDEAWKDRNARALEPRIGSAHEVLSAEQIAYVRSRLRADALELTTGAGRTPGLDGGEP